MAKISALPAATTLDGTEQTVCVQAGASSRSTTQAIANRYQGTAGTDIASATTTDIGAATGMSVHVTGTTTITGLGTIGNGTLRFVTFDGILTLTHNATSLILPGGANIATAAGDCALFKSEGAGNWRCLGYWPKNGQSVVADGSVVTALATSGTIAIDCALGDYFTLAAAGNLTSFTFSNPPASGKAKTIMVEIKQDATGSRVATFPSSFKWAGGTVGVLSTPANSVDVLALTTFDQGTTWRATLAKAFA